MRTRIVLFLTVLLVPELVIRPTAAVTATATTSAAAVQANALWEPPTGLRDRDLFYGPWGARLQPDPHAVYTFVQKKQTGTNPGVIVRDPQGRVWHVKQGKGSGLHAEGPVEVVVSRVLSAVGYHQPPVYYLPSFTMREGTSTHSEPGGRFRLDEPSLREVGNWSWDDPSVKGSRPYNGLLVILLTFASWDFKQSNNSIYEVRRNGRPETWYIVRDLGAALGGEGHLQAAKNDVNKFEQQGFIRGLSNGYVDFDYGGKRGDLYRSRITVEDVRWATNLLAGLDDRQWRDAFRAGGYPADVSERFIQKIKTNIVAGEQLTGTPRELARSQR
jgi:hypothetical protein